ncbi:MAG: lipid-A-disaccharide synthase [Chlorobi bacterium]|nr:lipid-A-disaccharide synthase [Chlorobiota bacterium]
MPQATNSKSIFISAGEQSGDLHGSELIKELVSQCPEFKLSFHGLGGDKMKNEGLITLHHVTELATVGFTDVVKKYGYFKKVINDCVKFIKENNPDTVILIDYPGFNIRLAEKIRSFYKNKIIYYISPQLWAWHEKRVNKVRKCIDKMLVVFPFEVDFYRGFGIDAEYVGHPLVKKIKNFLEQYKKSSKLFGGEKVITVLPGSRKVEIKNHLPVIFRMLSQIGKEFDIKVNISKASSVNDRVFNDFSEIKKYNLTSENVYKLILESDIVLTKAGTSTMECALIGTPHLIFYKTFPINYYILKPVVKVNFLGIVNILARESIVKEYIQKEFNPEKILLEAKHILTSTHYREKMTTKLNGIWDLLGDKDASFTAAGIIKDTALK